MEKDSAILSVLDGLYSRLGPEAFIVADHWEVDLCAVGIASPLDSRVLVYICKYSTPAGLFDYELELPPLPDSEAIYEVAGTGSGVSFDELACVVTRHLEQASSRF